MKAKDKMMNARQMDEMMKEDKKEKMKGKRKKKCTDD